jgi:hypothetical protein
MIAIGVGSIIFLLAYYPFSGGSPPFYYSYTFRYVGRLHSIWLLIVFPSMIATIVAYGILTYYYGPEPYDNENHCRKCGYNLTGNVSGICPECGERI